MRIWKSGAVASGHPALAKVPRGVASARLGSAAAVAIVVAVAGDRLLARLLACLLACLRACLLRCSLPFSFGLLLASH